MRTSLGISAGNEVVCSALVTTAPNGAQTFDYRIVSAEAHSDLGDLVTSSIELMTTQLPASHPHHAAPVAGGHVASTRSSGLDAVAERPPTGVAVAYRSKEQAQAIRSAAGRQRSLRLVQEVEAALTYLRDTGLVDRYVTVGVVDLGASGLSVTVAEQADGSVLHSARTNSVSGRAIDDLIYHHLVDQHYARRSARPNRSVLVNRARAAKEHLSIAPAVTVDHVAGKPLQLTRTQFEDLIADLLRQLAAFTVVSLRRAAKQPESVVVIGGGANIPSVLDALERELDIPVLTVPDPDAVIAKGAALVADSAQPSSQPVTLGGDAPVGTFAKVAGVLIGAIVVVGLIIGYGVTTLAPTSGEEVSPAGTTSSAQLPPTPPAAPTTETAAPTPEQTPDITRPPDTTIAPTTTYPVPQPVYPAPSSSANSSTTAPSPSTSQPSTSQPTLRPDPDLPPIPFPELPELFGPLLPSTTPPAETPTPEGQTPAQEDSATGTPGPDAEGPAPLLEEGTPTQSPAQTTRPQSPPRPNSGSAG